MSLGLNESDLDDCMFIIQASSSNLSCSMCKYRCNSLNFNPLSLLAALICKFISIQIYFTQIIKPSMIILMSLPLSACKTCRCNFTAWIGLSQSLLAAGIVWTPLVQYSWSIDRIYILSQYKQWHALNLIYLDHKVSCECSWALLLVFVHRLNGHIRYDDDQDQQQ